MDSSGQEARTITIFHVDDDDDIRAIAELALGLVAWSKLFQFPSGQDAIRAIESIKPDLLLLDVLMPGLSGEDTWKKIQKLPNMERIPTIFMTAKAESKYGKKLVDLGAIGVITKPFDPITLGDQIMSLLVRHGKLVSPSIH